MVLAGGQGQHIFAIAQNDEAGFFALQKFFDHHACATGVVGHAEFVVEQHEVNRFVRFLRGHGHHHAFASGQAIGFDHNRRAFDVHIVVRSLCVGEGLVFGGGNVVALHEGFAERLRAFELRRRLGGAKNAQTMGAKFVNYPCGQWRFGTNHGEFDVF